MFYGYMSENRLQKHVILNKIIVLGDTFKHFYYLFISVAL